MNEQEERRGDVPDLNPDEEAALDRASDRAAAQAKLEKAKKARFDPDPKPMDSR